MGPSLCLWGYAADGSLLELYDREAAEFTLAARARKDSLHGGAYEEPEDEEYFAEYCQSLNIPYFPPFVA
jgi:hypothetical protein